MSSALSFDTLAYVKHLRAADIPEQQAEAQAEALRIVLDTTLAEQSVAMDTKTERALAVLERKVDIGFAEMRGNITLLKWMMGFVLAGIVSLVVKSFF